MKLANGSITACFNAWRNGTGRPGGVVSAAALRRGSRVSRMVATPTSMQAAISRNAKVQPPYSAANSAPAPATISPPR